MSVIVGRALACMYGDGFETGASAALFRHAMNLKNDFNKT